MTYGVFDVVRDVFVGDVKLADPDTQKKRLDLCNSCDRLSKLRSCEVCYCFVDAKVTLEKAGCPLNKW